MNSHDDEDENVDNSDCQPYRLQVVGLDQTIGSEFVNTVYV